MIATMTSLVLVMAQPLAAAAAPPGAGSHLDVATVVAKVQKRYDEAADFRRASRRR